MRTAGAYPQVNEKLYTVGNDTVSNRTLARKLEGVPPKVGGDGIPSRWGGIPSRTAEGGACLFFALWVPLPPPALWHEGVPPSKVPQGGGMPHFPGGVSRRNLIRSYCSGGS